MKIALFILRALLLAATFAVGWHFGYRDAHLFHECPEACP